MAAVVVVVVVRPVLASDLPRSHRGLGQVQVQVFKPDVLVVLSQRGRRAPDGTEVNNRLRGKERTGKGT